MKVFDQIASSYDLGMLPLEWLVLRRLRKRLHPLPGQRILELGVGTGVNLRHHAQGSAVVAVDLSLEMLTLARTRATLARVSYAQASVERLPFGDRSFDTVLSSLLFCSVDDPAAGLREIRRVLRCGGQLLMLEHVRGISGPMRWLTDHLDGWWYGMNGSCHLNRETEQLVRGSGMTGVTASRHGLGLFQVISAYSPESQ